MSSENIKYHRKLAEYFGEKNLYLDEKNMKKPNTRKLVELPYQLALGEMLKCLLNLLEDLDFWETRCSNLKLHLIQDYRIWNYLASAGGKPFSIKQMRNGVTNYIWNFGSEGSVITIEETEFQIKTFFIHVTGIYVAIKNTIRRIPWSKEKIINFQTSHSELITDIMVSQDGRFLATASIDQNVVVTDILSRQEIRVFHTNDTKNSCLLLHPNQLFLIEARGREVTIWDIESGNKIKLFTMSKPVYGILYTPSGKFIWIDDEGQWNELENLNISKSNSDFSWEDFSESIRNAFGKG